MPRLFQRLFHRPALTFGLVEDRRSRFRNPRFASFIAQYDSRVRNSDAFDAKLRARRWVQRGLFAAAALGGAWVVVESAKAISSF